MPNLLARLHAAYKAVTLPYPTRNSGIESTYGYLYGYPKFDKLTDPWPRTQRAGVAFNVEDSAGNPHDNSVVAICAQKYLWNFTEPNLEVVEREEDGRWTPIPDHPAVVAIDEGNPWEDVDSLLSAGAVSYVVDGNAYWLKLRNRANQPIGLRWLEPWLISPASSDAEDLITHYLYEVGESKPREIDRQDVVHLRNGRDRSNPRRGCSALRALVLSLATDNEADRFTAHILHGLGIVGGLLTYEGEGPGPTPEEVLGIKARYREEYTGSGRGGLMVPTFPARYTELGRSPEQMALDIIRQVPEARLCAAMGIPPMVVGLTSGEGSKSYANQAEAREGWYEESLIPLHRRFAAGLTRWFLRELDSNARRRFRWNYDEVRVLQPDLDKDSARATREWMADGMTLNEYREKLGEKALEDSDLRGAMYFSEHRTRMGGRVAGAIESTGDRRANLPGDEVPANERTPPFGAEEEAKAVWALKARERRREAERSLVLNGNGKH